MADFISIATPFARLGIPVFPLMSGTKIPPSGLHWDKEASSDLNKVAEWNQANSNYNVGLAALPDGGFCFLEFDVEGGMKAAAREMGEKTPTTRVQQSGKGFAHFIFRHTERSRKIGNRSVNLPDGHEWFSFRASNKYLVGAGSLHPNGEYYKTIRDVDPAPIPDWLLDWIESNSKPVKSKGCDNTASVADDFDFDDFLDFYGIGGDQDGDWFITDVCPVSQHKHEGSVRTGFFYDGVSLGFHCFAQGCEGSQMSVGKVIAHLNALKGKPYRGVIWGEPDEDFDTSKWDVEIVDDVIAALPPMDIDQLEKLLNPETYEPAEIASMSDESRQAMSEASDKAKAHTSKMEALEAEEIEIGPEPEEEEKSDSHDPHLKWAAQMDVGGNGLGLLIKNASTYIMTELEWLWPQRIPKGKIVLYTGNPDTGKSMAVLDLIARVSTGSDFPDGSVNVHGASRVLLAASEDDPNDTLIPRLVAAGANLSNVEIVVGTVLRTKSKKETKQKRTALDLKRDAKMLLDAIKENPDIKLLCLDPLTSFFGDADQNKDKDIRPIMDEVSRMCSKSGITIVGIVHSNKRSDVSAVHKVSGAGSLAASVRAVWGFSRDSEDKKKGKMAFVKGNLGKNKSGINYSIEEVFITINGNQVGVPKLVWGDGFEEDADDILKAERNNKSEKDTKMIQAKALIMARMPIKAKSLYEEAEKEGISIRTVKSARYELTDVIVKRYNNEWWWFTAENSPMGVSKAFMEAETAVTEELTLAMESGGS